MLRAGRTAGVFQFESPLATDMLRAMRCDRFDDLVASNALMRPGPLDAGMHRVYQRRKRGEEPVDVRAPRARADPRADVRRHHLSGAGDAHRAGARGHLARRSRRAAQGGGQEGRGADPGRSSASSSRRRSRAATTGAIIEELAGQIETFGRYGFNKSHSVAYSVISYHTAWLKAHYPADFMAALLSSSIGDTDSVVKFINEARELGHRGAAAGRERVGLQVHRRRREANALRARRDPQRRPRRRSTRFSRRAAEKPFDDRCSISCERVDLRLCNKRVFEALIALGRARRRSAAIARSTWRCSTRAMQEASLKQQERETGPGLAVRRAATGTADAGSRSRQPRVLAEHRAAGRVGAADEGKGDPRLLHLRAPARAVPHRVRAVRDPHGVAARARGPREPMALGVVVTAIKRQISKRSGAEFARLTVEDFSGSSEVLVFPESWAVLADRVRTDVPVLVQGRLLEARPGRRQPDVHRRVGHAVRGAAVDGPGRGRDRAVESGKRGRRNGGCRTVPRQLIAGVMQTCGGRGGASGCRAARGAVE